MVEKSISSDVTEEIVRVLSQKLFIFFIALGFILCGIQTADEAHAQSALYNKSSTSSGSKSQKVSLFNSTTDKKYRKAPLFFNDKYSMDSASSGKGNRVIGDYYKSNTERRRKEEEARARQQARDDIAKAVAARAAENKKKNDDRLKLEAMREAKNQKAQNKGFRNTNQNTNSRFTSSGYSKPVVKYVYRR